jgi:hypothetical protein
MTLATTFQLTLGLYIPSLVTGQPPAKVAMDRISQFLVDHVCPLLDGFRVSKHVVSWKGEPEPCVVVTFTTTEDADLAYLKVYAIAQAYKSLYNQDSVLIHQFDSTVEFV